MASIPTRALDPERRIIVAHILLLCGSLGTYDLRLEPFSHLHLLCSASASILAFEVIRSTMASQVSLITRPSQINYNILAALSACTL